MFSLRAFVAEESRVERPGSVPIASTSCRTKAARYGDGQQRMNIGHRIFVTHVWPSSGSPGTFRRHHYGAHASAVPAWVIDLLDIQPHERVLEVGFGPGVGLQLLARSAGYVAGVDASEAMVEQATARNVQAIERGHVDVRHGSVERLPFEDHTFDKTLAMNSMQVWPDAMPGLRALWRVLRPGGRMALAFTPYAGQPKSGMHAMLTASAFTEAHVVETELGFCVLAIKP
jgi:SAM-dependent methyltransferase